MKKNLDNKIIFSLAAIYLIWGSTYLGIKFAIETFPPLLMSGIRYLGAGFLFLLILPKTKTQKTTKQQFRNACLIGALLMTGGTGVMAVAQRWVSTGMSAIGIAAVPLWSCLFAALWGNRPNLRETVGLVLGFIGIFILNSEKTLQAQTIGAILLFVAPIFWAFGSMLSRKIVLPKNVLVSTTIQMFSGGVCSILFGLSLGERFTQTPSLASILGVIYLIIFGSFIGYTLYQYLLIKVRPALATSYAFVNPLVAIFLGVILAGEKINSTIITALLVVTTGVAFVILGHQDKK